MPLAHHSQYFCFHLDAFLLRSFLFGNVFFLLFVSSVVLVFHRMKATFLVCIVFTLAFISIECLWFCLSLFWLLKSIRNFCCGSPPVMSKSVNNCWNRFYIAIFFFIFFSWCDSILFIFMTMRNWPFHSHLTSYGFSIAFRRQNRRLFFLCIVLQTESLLLAKLYLSRSVLFFPPFVNEECGMYLFCPLKAIIWSVSSGWHSFRW